MREQKEEVRVKEPLVRLLYDYVRPSELEFDVFMRDGAPPLFPPFSEVPIGKLSPKVKTALRVSFTSCSSKP